MLAIIRTIGTDKKLLIFVRKRQKRWNPVSRPLEGGGTRSVTEEVCDIMKANLTLSDTRTPSVTCKDSSLAEIAIMLARFFAL